MALFETLEKKLNSRKLRRARQDKQGETLVFFVCFISNLRPLEKWLGCNQMKIIHLKVKELIQQEAHLKCGCAATQPRRSPLQLAARRALRDSGTEEGCALGSSLQGFHWELGRLAAEGWIKSRPSNLPWVRKSKPKPSTLLCQVQQRVSWDPWGR